MASAVAYLGLNSQVCQPSATVGASLQGTAFLNLCVLRIFHHFQTGCLRLFEHVYFLQVMKDTSNYPENAQN